MGEQMEGQATDIGARAEAACQRGIRRLVSGILAMLIAGGALWAMPATAQDSAATQDTASAAGASLRVPPVCLFRTESAREPAPGMLQANCGGRIFGLGLADSYTPVSNPGLKAEIVDVRWRAERHVWLLSQQDDGQFLLEDLSGSIALSAGRGPMSDLRGLDIDISGFATGALVAVAPQAQAPGKAGQVRVGDQIAAERARRHALLAGN
jgi:hypothetical protein